MSFVKESAVAAVTHSSCLLNRSQSAVIEIEIAASGIVRTLVNPLLVDMACGLGRVFPVWKAPIGMNSFRGRHADARRPLAAHVLFEFALGNASVYLRLEYRYGEGIVGDCGLSPLSHRVDEISSLLEKCVWTGRADAMECVI